VLQLPGGQHCAAEWLWLDTLLLLWALDTSDRGVSGPDTIVILFNITRDHQGVLFLLSQRSTPYV
jgi:hypothetical protein